MEDGCRDDLKLAHMELRGAFPRGRQPGYPERVQPQPRPPLQEPASPSAPERRERSGGGAGKNANWVACCSSVAAMVRHHLACCESLSAPRYNSVFCTVRPPRPRRFSTTFQPGVFSILLSLSRPQQQTAPCRWPQALRQGGWSSLPRRATPEHSITPEIWRLLRRKKSVYGSSCERRGRRTTGQVNSHL